MNHDEWTKTLQFERRHAYWSGFFLGGIFVLTIVALFPMVLR